MLDKNTVLPIPPTLSTYLIDIPFGKFYEELVWGAIANLTSYRFENMTVGESDEYVSAVLKILDSVRLYTPPSSGGSMQAFNAARVITADETAPANVWYDLSPNSIGGDATIDGSGAIVINDPGTWRVDYSMYVRQSNQAQMRLLVNGVVHSYSSIAFSGSISSAPADRIIGSALVQLVAGDALKFQIRVRNSATGNIGSIVNYDPAATLITLLVSGLRVKL